MILAIDPGTIKSGIAIIENDGQLVMKTIIATENLEKEIITLLTKYLVHVIVSGNGTNHKAVKKRLTELLKAENISLSIELVNEKYTTEMGEEWYWRDHKPKGWKRIIPKGFRTVPVPIDDYVAWIIGNIYIGRIKEKHINHKKT